MTTTFNQLKNTILKFTKSLGRAYNKTTLWGKILIFIVLLLLLVLVFKGIKPNKMYEGFEQNDQFLFKTGPDIYDDFYASFYDDLVYNDFKNEYEIGEIVNRTAPSDQSIILDLGSGTGHHLKEFKQRGFKCQGIDKSQSMVRVSKEKFPDINVKVGDFMHPMQFQPSELTHITC